ncbi:MAG: YwiC-like family protein [Opitutaceae bacterium]|nr:YwiC-like family protein [Opitutaceae bacterium]
MSASAIAVFSTTRSPSVFLPKEHGSWSLALEPISLGLFVAFSPAGGALAVSAIAAFFLRRPLKRLATRRDPASARAVTLLGFCALGGLAAAVILAGWAPLRWLIPTLPLGGLFLYWDSQNESRATQAELAACGVFAFLPAAMAAQAGLPDQTALALCVLMLARSLPTVLIIRTYLRRRKGHAVSTAPAVSVTALTLAALLTLAATAAVPWIAVLLITLAALRVLLLVPALAPDWPARRIGIGEACFGLLFLLTTSIAWAGLLP